MTVNPISIRTGTISSSKYLPFSFARTNEAEGIHAGLVLSAGGRNETAQLAIVLLYGSLLGRFVTYIYQPTCVKFHYGLYATPAFITSRPDWARTSLLSTMRMIGH